MKNHYLLNFILFICFLLIGYTVSTEFYPPVYRASASNMDSASIENENPIATMDNGQRSILLIGAKGMNTIQPRLESIWLASYLPPDTTIRLLPIFPTGNKPLSDFEDRLVHSFGLSKKTEMIELDQEFTEVLEKNNYWWSGYFVFDEVALLQLLGPIGYVQLNGQILSGEQAIKGSPEGSENPQAAYSYQLAILQSACHKLIGGNLDLDIPQITSLVPNHILTNLEADQLLDEFDTLYSGERAPTCRFPTLEFSRASINE